MMPRFLNEKSSTANRVTSFRRVTVFCYFFLFLVHVCKGQSSTRFANFAARLYLCIELTLFQTEKSLKPYGFTLFIIKEERFIYTGLDLVNQVVPGALSFLPPSLPFPIGGARRSRAPPAARGAGASSLKRGRRSSPASS